MTSFAGEKFGTEVSDLSPAQSESFARVNNRLRVHDYLPRAFHDGSAAAGKCEWSSYLAVELTMEERGALAWILIDSIMKARFGVVIQHYNTWREYTLTGARIPSSNLVIPSFIKPVFGLPNEQKSEHHLQGHVAEWIWHLLTKDSHGVRVQLDPKGDVTDAGGDSFTIYESSTGDLRFRLWESKKNTGTQPLSTSLSKAYTQLDKHGPRYVAKIVGTFGHLTSDTSQELRDLVVNLPDAWAQGDQLVGAGVMLGTHQLLPVAPFNNMAAKLPFLNKPGQLRGLAASICCYAELADLVRSYAWTAL